MSTWDGQKKIFAPPIERPAWGSFKRQHFHIKFFFSTFSLYTPPVESCFWAIQRIKEPKKADGATLKWLSVARISACAAHKQRRDQ